MHKSTFCTNINTTSVQMQSTNNVLSASAECAKFHKTQSAKCTSSASAECAKIKQLHTTKYIASASAECAKSCKCKPQNTSLVSKYPNLHT